MEVAEEIHIATKWEQKGDDGYVGEGFTKRGIYVSIIMLMPAVADDFFQARFMGKEYVITQPINPVMENASVESVLRAEYGLLCVGDTLKKEFDRHAQECGVVTIPGA
jgi:hypothetical protein